MPTYYTYYIYSRSTEVIYVGYTTNPTYRFDNHENKKTWWSEVDTITLFPHETYEDAVAFEKHSLELHRPKYNVEGVTKPYRAPTKPGDTRTGSWDSVLDRLEWLEMRLDELLVHRLHWPYHQRQFEKLLFDLTREPF